MTSVFLSLPSLVSLVSPWFPGLGLLFFHLSLCSPLACSLRSLSHPQAVYHSLGLCHLVPPKLCFISLHYAISFPLSWTTFLAPTPTAHATSLPQAIAIITSSLCHLILPSCVTYILLAPANHFPQALDTFPSLPGPIYENHREKWLPGPALGPLHHPEWW